MKEELVVLDKNDESILLVESKPDNVGKKATPSRLVYLDMFKGLIMVFMALDHCKHNFTDKKVLNDTSFSEFDDPVQAELWYHTADYDGNWLWFFTRQITHTVAVGFAFSMGIGFYFLFQSRIKLNWSWFRIFKYYLLRAIIVIVLEQVLNLLFLLIRMIYYWTAPTSMYFGTQILFSLGCNMIIGCLVLLAQKYIHLKFPDKQYLGDIAVLVFTFLLAFSINYAIPRPPSADHVPNPLVALLMVPHAWQHGTVTLSVFYTILPWTSPVCLGILMGRVCCEKPSSSRKVIGISCICCFVFFLIVRLPYTLHAWNFGSFRPIVDNLTYYSFFGMAKYPPSLSFISFWLGVDLFMIFVLTFLTQYENRFPFYQLKTMGQAALFFYALHLSMYTIMGLPFPKSTIALGGVYIEWLIGLYLCYAPTKAFGNFKLTKDKDSLWRLF